MKKLMMITASVLGLSLQSLAHGYGNAYVNSYADAIVFDEMGITFSVYPDGEFDFYLGNAMQTSTVSNGFVNVTFNSGYDYNPYVQYDDFGAVIQVENVPIWYDYYGRVSQIGDVQISYRNRRLHRVGGLNVFYNAHGHYAYHTGFINVWNPYFVYRPFYVAFARPRPAMCFVRVNPYRQFYRPVRYTYYRPYVNNIRPCYATIGHTYRPSGYGQVHSRYTQQARRGEVPVRRERTKITTAYASQRPSVANAARGNASSMNNGYTRSTQQNRTSDVRTAFRANSTSDRGSESGRNATRTAVSQPRSVAPNRSSSATSARTRSAAKPNTVSQSRSNGQTSGRIVRSSSSTNSSSRAVRPSSSGRTNTGSVGSSNRIGPAPNRSVQPSSNSRSTTLQSRAVSKPSATPSRSGSRSAVSKGSSSSSKPGGKVSVGSRSSKQGR